MNLFVCRVAVTDTSVVWWMWDANRRIKGGSADTLYDLLYRWRGECGPHSNVVVRFAGTHSPEDAERLFAESRGLPKITVTQIVP